MPDRKKPNWPLWITAAVLLPVLYVLGFGPACWLADRHESLTRVVEVAYRPLMIACVRIGCGKALCAYGTLVPLPIEAGPLALETAELVLIDALP